MKTDYAYQPYGTASVSDTSNTNTYEYTGRELDGSGLQYNRNRYYNPAWGRFVSEDPIGFAGGINVYGYGAGNPISYSDPNGKFFFVATAVVGAVGGFFGDLAYQELQNLRYHRSARCIDFYEATTAGVFGGIGGAALPFVGFTALDAAVVGADTGIAQYAYTNGAQSTVQGAVVAAAAGGLGGYVAGSLNRTFMFFTPSPFSPSQAAASANSGAGSFFRNILGGATAAYNPDGPSHCGCQ